LVGGANGLVSGYLGTPGPLAAPFYLAYGLTGIGFVGTTAAGAVHHRRRRAPNGGKNGRGVRPFWY